MARAINEYFTYQVNALAINTLGIPLDPSGKSGTFNSLNQEAGNWAAKFLQATADHMNEEKQRDYLERVSACAVPPEEFAPEPLKSEGKSADELRRESLLFAKMLRDPNFAKMGAIMAELYDYSRTY